MRRYESFPVKDKNSMQYWTNFISPLKVVINFIVIQITRYSPSLTFKNFLYRNFLGMKVGKHASVGLMVMVDIFWPEKIRIGNNTIIGYNSTILVHEYLTKELRRGPVEIGDNVMIGANTTILPGVKIGDNSIVSACSLVNKDVAPNSVVGGVPIKTLKENRDDNN